MSMRVIAYLNGEESRRYYNVAQVDYRDKEFVITDKFGEQIVICNFDRVVVEVPNDSSSV